MSPFRRLACALLLLASALPALAGGGPADTVVLVNDASPDSVRVAEHYVRARQIPATNVCVVKSATAATVPMADFVRDVVDPLRLFLRRAAMTDRVRFVVLTQGFPIRAKTAGNHVSTAAVLSLLDTSFAGRDQGRMPFLRNPYREGVAPRTPIEDFGRPLMVTALLSSTADEALALVDRSVASDGTAPKRAHLVYQDANGNARVRNGMYDGARKLAEQFGHTTEHVEAGPTVVTERKRVIAYMSGGAYSKLAPDKVALNEYLPGAICDMLQSFGATPPNFVPGGKGQQFPITHMVRAGITGVHGCVAEPYTIAFAGADLFTPYLQGFTLAETFHQKLPHAYWMNLVLGDPLCAPYAQRPAPVVTVDRAPPQKNELSGVVTIEVRAKSAERFEVFVDGAPVGDSEGPRGSIPLDTSLLTPGEHQLLVQAIGPGAHEPTGWNTFTIHTTGGTAPAGAARTPVASLTIEAKATVKAGRALAIRVIPVDAEGKACEAQTPIEIRTAKPPVRWVAEPSRNDAFALNLTKAGRYTLLISAPDSGIETTHEVTVEHGPAHHATTPLSSVPQAQVVDLPVRIEDEHGNAVSDWEGTLAVQVMGMPDALVPAPIEITSGKGVFRDVILPRSGAARLIFTNGSGKVMSLSGEGVRVQPTAVRTWFAGSAAPASELAAGDPAEHVTRDGTVSGDRLFRRLRSRGDEVRLATAGVAESWAAPVVTFLRAYQDIEAKLLLAAHGPVRVLVDGKEVFSGKPPSADMRKPKAVGEIRLPKGERRLTVVVERAGKFAFSLRLAAEQSKFPGGLHVIAASARGPERSVVSGTVRTGRKPLSGVKVHLTAADGTSRESKTDRSGAYWFDDVAAGTVTVAVGGAGFTPAMRELPVHQASIVTDLDFTFTDTTAPVVTLPDLGARPRFGKTIRLSPTVEDSGGVALVRLLVNGADAGAVKKAPWTLALPTPAGARGTVELVVVAIDGSGNEGRSAPVRVQIVQDDKPPTIKVSGLKARAMLKKPARVTLTVSDALLGVAAVKATVDGKPVETAPDSRGRLTLSIDPAKLPKGDHKLVITAADLDGNEGSKTVAFRTR